MSKSLYRAEYWTAMHGVINMALRLKEVAMNIERKETKGKYL